MFDSILAFIRSIIDSHKAITEQERKAAEAALAALEAALTKAPQTWESDAALAEALSHYHDTKPTPPALVTPGASREGVLGEPPEDEPAPPYHGVAVALYGAGDGVRSTWGRPELQAWLAEHRIGVHVHCGPRDMVTEGAPTIAEALRLGLAPAVGSLMGDYYAGDELLRLWSDAAGAVQAALGSGLMLNCEARWLKSRERVELAAAAMRMLRADHPGLAILHTAWDHPLPIRRLDTWKGGFEYPWAEFLSGLNRADCTVPQVYWGPGSPDPDRPRLPPGRGPMRHATHLASYEKAVNAGVIAADIDRGIYLQGYGVHVYDLCRLGIRYRTVVFWDAPQWDRHGSAAAATLAELFRRGYGGREDGISAFQRDAGLEEDGKAGPLTRAALGLEELSHPG